MEGEHLETRSFLNNKRHSDEEDEDDDDDDEKVRPVDATNQTTI